MGNLVSKQELVDIISEEVNLPKKITKGVIESVVSNVTRLILEGNEVRISGLGTFKTTRRNARQGVNPQTGSKLKIAASMAPKFTFASGVKTLVKGLKVPKKP